jgi:hypothetical protein
MRLMAKNYPFIHKPYTLCLLCVLRGEFLQWTHPFIHEPYTLCALCVLRGEFLQWTQYS